jgi:hypothetical protein
MVEMENEESILALALHQVDIGNFDQARYLVWIMFLSRSDHNEEPRINETRNKSTINWNGQAIRLFDENTGGGDGMVSDSCKWTFKLGSLDCSNADCPFRERCRNKAGQIINKWSISVDTVGTIATTLDNLFGKMIRREN